MTDAVRVVRIDQPEVRNAINTATAQRLHDEFVAFDHDESAKVAVLTGDAAAFCKPDPDAAVERVATCDARAGCWLATVR